MSPAQSFVLQLFAHFADDVSHFLDVYGLWFMALVFFLMAMLDLSGYFVSLSYTWRTSLGIMCMIASLVCLSWAYLGLF